MLSNSGDSTLKGKQKAGGMSLGPLGYGESSQARPELRPWLGDELAL